LFLSFTGYFSFGIAVFAPRARYSFATAQKSTQKRPPRQLRPCIKHRGSQRKAIVSMLCQNSRTLKDTYAQTAGPENPCQQHPFTGLLRWKENHKQGDPLFFCAYRFYFCFVFSCFLTPLSIAEFTGIGRAISPGKAKLALCARMAHQGGLVGNSGKFRHPKRFSRGNRIRTAFFGYFF